MRVVVQREVSPAALLIARGGSIAAAMDITGDVLRLLMEHGIPDPQATWVAFVIDRHDCASTVDWDPDRPIPEGTILLRCSGWTTSG
jgi:hypothetical protein